jgi:hypothetical protein
MSERRVRDLERPARLGLRPVVTDTLLTFRPRRRVTAVQRKEPVDAGRRTHPVRHQADVRFGLLHWPERQLCEVLLTFPPRHHV